MKKEVLDNIDKKISQELKGLRETALNRASSILNKPINIHSLSGIIGGKNNRYVDSVRTQFSDFDDFFSRWLKGLINEVKEKKKQAYTHSYFKGTSAYRVSRLIDDPYLFKYTRLFLERNFYRNYLARIRDKPTDELWSLWFGDNKMTWGLILAPVYRNGNWTNDVSEIRRANYHYWTIGHILETGLIDPESTQKTTFHNIDQLLTFYRSVLKRVSNSTYEKEIADRYIDYINKSNDPHSEPFLIPELRYAGLNSKHKYRLDYTILNSYTMSYTGFELSPHSTHMKISGSDKTLKKHNEELLEKWEAEMDKRNNYFSSFGISTVTFTDRKLKNLQKCFDEMELLLSARPDERFEVNELRDELSTLIS